MKTEFRKSFSNDLKNVSDRKLLARVGKIIETVENADALTEIKSRKKLKRRT